jgi:alkyl hydroperoxide reductase subunit F
MYDLIIIGAGPAGITASVYAARKRMDFLVITKDIGGQAAWSGDIENYTGYQFISGPELASKFEEHMRKYNINVKEEETVREVKKINNITSVVTDKAEYQAKSLIIASGKRTKELNVPGEKEFKNKGLSYCATCDGPLFTGKDVAVIGAGNSALDAVLQLIKIAKHIYLINIGKELTGDPIMQEKVKESEAVTILNNVKVTAITGEKMVSGIKIKKENQEEILSVQGVFVEIGLIPNSEFVEGIERNSLSEIKVNDRNETNIPGIFAAGDVTDVPEKQIIIAAGEGSKASLSAFRYLLQNRV